MKGFSITSLGHTTLVPSVVYFLVPVPAFLVGMEVHLLSGLDKKLLCFPTCKSVAIWAIEAPSFNIAKVSVSLSFKGLCPIMYSMNQVIRL